MPENTKHDRRTRGSSGFIQDGYDQIVKDAELRARQIVEQKYAEEWNGATWFRRWKLRRKIELEITQLADQMMPDICPESLF